jgi:hypothetical protein
MKKLFKEIHEAWLAIQFTGFMSQTQSRQELYEFSNILFKHLTWIENDFVKQKMDYSYDINQVPIRVDKLSTMISDIIRRIELIESELESCNDEHITFRMSSDLNYMKSALEKLDDEDVSSAFNMKKEFPKITLTQDAQDALTLFLFEESYKEYELIMVYFYMQIHSDNLVLNDVYQDLVDESHFHLKCFGNMLAKMGILNIPRTIIKELYTTTDIKQFMLDGIEEEKGAKEMCTKLAAAVNDEELAKFFDFINYQENYHIELMQKALKVL